MKQLGSGVIVFLLLVGAATPQTLGDVIKAKVSLAQEIGFGYGLIVQKKIHAVTQKDMKELLEACDQLDRQDTMIRKQAITDYDPRLVETELGDMRATCVTARQPGAHFQ